MPKFKYVAVGPDGNQVTGLDEAPSFSALANQLLERGLNVREATEKKSLMQLELTKKKVPRKDLMHFSRQLAAFLRSGISILDALETICSEMTNKVFKEALLDVAEGIRGGGTFAGTARVHPEAFPPVYLAMLESAEMTGNLDQVLDQLASYVEREMEARRKVMSALLYPGIVLVMSIVTVAVLSLFVLPRFKTFFESLDAQLPLPTRILLGMTGLVMDFWFVFPLLALALGGAVFYSVRAERGRQIRDNLVLRIPVIGDLIKTAIIERFCRVLASMVRAGVPLPDALLVTTESTNNAVWKTSLADARDEMLEGRGLATPISETGLFPGAARQMFRVGEDTGTLPDQLQASANYYEQELDYKINRFTSLFEPAIILFMGVVVGFVAIALVTAMYGIFGQVNNI